MAVKELTTESSISDTTQEKVTAVFYKGNKVAEIGNDKDGFYCLATKQYAKWIKSPRKDIDAATIEEALEVLKSVTYSKPAKVEKTPLGTWARKA